jgi:hypothetical protein
MVLRNLNEHLSQNPHIIQEIHTILKDCPGINTLVKTFRKDPSFVEF